MIWGLGGILSSFTVIAGGQWVLFVHIMTPLAVSRVVQAPHRGSVKNSTNTEYSFLPHLAFTAHI